MLYNSGYQLGSQLVLDVGLTCSSPMLSTLIYINYHPIPQKTKRYQLDTQGFCGWELLPNFAAFQRVLKCPLESLQKCSWSGCGPDRSHDHSFRTIFSKSNDESRVEESRESELKQMPTQAWLGFLISIALHLMMMAKGEFLDTLLSLNSMGLYENDGVPQNPSVYQYFPG